MTITGRTATAPGGPDRAAPLAFEAQILGTNAVGAGGASTNLCSAQSFDTIAAASGSVVIDGTASFWFKTSGAKAYFGYPQFITIQCSAPGAGTNQGNFKITGRNQFDEPVIEVISYASGTSSTNSSVTCWKFIDSITFASTGVMGDTTATVSVGWKLSNNSTAFPPRLPLPWKPRGINDIIGIIIVDDGGSNCANLGAGTDGGILAAGSMTINVGAATIAFACGAVTTQPTTTMRFLIIPANDVVLNR